MKPGLFLGFVLVTIATGILTGAIIPSTNAHNGTPAPFVTSEAGYAAMAQIQEDALKTASLPTDIYQVIDRKFGFCYGDYGVAIGTITGIELLENHDVILHVSVPSIKEREVQYLKYIREPKSLTGWWAIGAKTKGDLRLI